MKSNDLDHTSLLLERDALYSLNETGFEQSLPR